MKPYDPSTPRPSGFRSLLNWKGAVVLVAVLAVVDVAVAFGLSPLVTGWATDAVNKYTNARVSIERLRLHPVLLTLTAQTIEAADPDDHTRRMFLADSLRATLDPVALLAGNVHLGTLSFKQVELVLVKDAQGDFNVAKLIKKDPEEKPAGGWTSGVKEWFGPDRRDWFGNAYERAKQWVRKPEDGKKKDEPKTIEVREEPKGRVVDFSSPDDPAFRIGSIRIHGGRVVLSDSTGVLPPLEDLKFHLNSFVMRRAGGFEFDSIGASGRLKTAREGSFDLGVDRTNGSLRAKLVTKDLDLAPLRALYAESSPVSFDRGYLTLDCRSELTATTVHSRNELKLEDYHMVLTKGDARIGPVPAALVVDALNRRSEFELKFEITGDPDKPSMSGFETTLWNLVKDDLGSQALQTLESKAGVKLGELSQKLKNLF